MQVANEKAKFHFFNHSEGIFYDERKKRFVDFKDMDKRSLMSYMHSDFRSVSILIKILVASRFVWKSKKDF